MKCINVYCTQIVQNSSDYKLYNTVDMYAKLANSIVITSYQRYAPFMNENQKLTIAIANLHSTKRKHLAMNYDLSTYLYNYLKLTIAKIVLYFAHCDLKCKITT